MTSTIGPMLENCCSPCCDDGCNSVSNISIESTNPECLSVDTSECGVIKLTPTCPKPTYVKAGDGVTIKEVLPPDDCYASGGDCGIKGGWEISSSDELVKACPDDTTPGTLSEKLEAGHGISLTLNGCDGNTDSSIRIAVDESKFNMRYPPIVVRNGSNLINVAVSGDDGHTLSFSDKEETSYGNMVCIGFTADQNFSVKIDNNYNAETPVFMGEGGHNWSIFTGNPSMATRQGIKILADGYYRLFGQITVENNTNGKFYINLGRGLLRINGDREILNEDMYLSTAKHGAYARQILLNADNGIDVTDEGVIQTGTGEGQTGTGFSGPWMTYNIDTLVDLWEGDVVTLGYRPQSNLSESAQKYAAFRFVGQDDISTDYNALFGGTLLGCYQIAPKCFQKNQGNEVYGTI